MGRSNTSTTNNSAERHPAWHGSLLLLPRRRKILSLILLFAAIGAPIRGLTQSKDQQKRELGIVPTPSPTHASGRALRVISRS